MINSVNLHQHLKPRYLQALMCIYIYINMYSSYPVSLFPCLLCPLSIYLFPYTLNVRVFSTLLKDCCINYS